MRYMAPVPKQKPLIEEEEVVVKERLYKLEVFTSDLLSAGTNANVRLKADVYFILSKTVGASTKQKVFRNR